MWRYDGWASELKLGVVAPHADVGPEAEMQAMLHALPATVHGARVHFAPMHPGGTIDEKIAHDPVLRFVDRDVLDIVVGSLSSAPLDVIALAFTSSSFKLGARGEQELLDRLGEVSHEIPLETTGRAAVAAIRSLGLERVAVMAPSWFDEELCRAGMSYFVEQDVDVVSVTPSGPAGGPLAITAATMSYAVAELVARTGADAVLIAGNGQRAVGAIEHLESSLGVTVLTANQVLLWSALRVSALRGRVEGYGRLFREGVT